MVVYSIGMEIYFIEFTKNVVQEVASFKAVNLFIEVEFLDDVTDVWTEVAQVLFEVLGDIAWIFREFLEVVWRHIVKRHA